MDLQILKELFGNNTAFFLYGFSCGLVCVLFYANKVLLPQQEIKLQKKIIELQGKLDKQPIVLSRNCRLIECAYGGYRNEVKVTLLDDKIINCACPNFNWQSYSCLVNDEPCPLFKTK